MENSTLITAIHNSINLRGTEFTTPFGSKAGIRTRKNSNYMGSAYKMIFNKCLLRASGVKPSVKFKVS